MCFFFLGDFFLAHTRCKRNGCRTACLGVHPPPPPGTPPAYTVHQKGFVFEVNLLFLLDIQSCTVGGRTFIVNANFFFFLFFGFI